MTEWEHTYCYIWDILDKSIKKKIQEKIIIQFLKFYLQGLTEKLLFDRTFKKTLNLENLNIYSLNILV